MIHIVTVYIMAVSPNRVSRLGPRKLGSFPGCIFKAVYAFFLFLNIFFRVILFIVGWGKPYDYIPTRLPTILCKRPPISYRCVCQWKRLKLKFLEWASHQELEDSPDDQLEKLSEVSGSTTSKTSETSWLGNLCQFSWKPPEKDFYVHL